MFSTTPSHSSKFPKSLGTDHLNLRLTHTYFFCGCNEQNQAGKMKVTRKMINVYSTAPTIVLDPNKMIQMMATNRVSQV